MELSGEERSSHFEMVGALSAVRKRGGGRQVAAYFARVLGRGSHPHPALSLNGEGKSGVSPQGLGITRGWCSKAWGARKTPHPRIESGAASDPLPEEWG